MVSLLLEDFRNANLPELSDDMSQIMSLNTAFSILVRCENVEDCKYEGLPKNLKDSVDHGLDLGIQEIDKLVALVDKRIHEETTYKEKYYLYQLLEMFSGYIRCRSIIDATLKDEKLSREDVEGLELLKGKLVSLKNEFKEIKRRKRVKNDEAAQSRIDREVQEINNRFFCAWSRTNASLSQQYM
jgi:hypothetical protein